MLTGTICFSARNARCVEAEGAAAGCTCGRAAYRRMLFRFGEVRLIALLFLAVTAALVLLLLRNHALENRWRCARYCWQSMSDYAAWRLGTEGGVDDHWREVMGEQAALMSRFGARPLTDAEIRLYEAALLERGLPILVEHKV